jgi:hypothetical protein
VPSVPDLVRRSVRLGVIAVVVTALVALLLGLLAPVVAQAAPAPEPSTPTATAPPSSTPAPSAEQAKADEEGHSMIVKVTGYFYDHILAKTAQATARWYMKLMIGIEPNLLGTAFLQNYAVALRIEVMLLLPILMVATIHAILTGGLAQLLRTWVIGLPVAILAGVAAIAVVALCQKIDADLCVPLAQNAESWVNKWIVPMFAAGLYSQGLWWFLIAFLIIIFSIALYMELMVRAVTISMALLFIPIALATWVWPATRKWAITLFEVVLTAVFSKFIIFAILDFGFTMVTYAMGGIGDSSRHQLGMVFGGLSVMFLSCVAGPVLVAWVLSPGHRPVSRREMAQRHNISNGRIYMYQTFYSGAKKAV